VDNVCVRVQITASVMSDILSFVGNPHARARREMIHAVDALKASGLKVALLTNNWFTDDAQTKSLVLVEANKFDVVVESCRVGARKPERSIYEHVLAKLACQPNEAIFLDDLETNIAGAQAVGIETIHVHNDHSTNDPASTALKLLAKRTHVDLGVPGD
jgi:epoxide hydrolase-like predicted phosphatase